MVLSLTNIILRKINIIFILTTVLNFIWNLNVHNFYIKKMSELDGETNSSVFVDAAS